MTDTKDIPRPRTMTLSDLWAVVEIHKKCFPPSISIFTALGDDVLKFFYTHAIEKPYNIATVLEDPKSGQVVAFVIGTMKLGFRVGVVRHHLIRFCWYFICGFFLDSTVRKQTWKYIGLLKKSFRRRVHYAPSDSTVPSVREGNYMLIGVHPQWRGQGNARRILDYFVNRMFEAGARRVRTRVRIDNIPSLTMHKRLGWNMKRVSEDYISVWVDQPETAS